MSNENIYSAPQSDLLSPISSQNITSYRKGLIPLWIKIFGWLFIILGFTVTGTGIFSAITGTPGAYSIYGLGVYGKIYSPLAMFILSLFIVHAISAYGLLFAKDWGLLACLILGYISAAICIFTMLTPTDTEINIRLELIVLILYLVKLHKIRKNWSAVSIAIE